MSDLAGGFVPLSPPPSSIASSATRNSLPQPRRTPLKPGGTKESRLIRHVDQQLLHIQRRFAKRDPSLGHEGVREMDEEGRMIEQLNDPATEKRLQQSEEWNDVQGYAGFAEAARDVEELIAVIWVSGTPALQVPYLINMALLTTTMIPAFPLAPRPLFRLLGKLDHAFASLLVGRDVSTDEILPGFNTGRGVSGTEKVRIKSLVERTRICVVEVVNRGEFDEDDDLDEPSPEDTDMDGALILDEDDGPQDINVDDTEDDDWNMQVARVYDKTLVELGDSMDGPPIGIRTEARIGT
ncbi:hypothetical protein D6C90_09419 [Aureobasidium pullulans]|uniref:Uncharacterized protein n=1 Tax=Aureobasidium pullulans TaxID=5580 RepID=A0A4S9TCJ6_AURPU|nr:hypothetical protein D6C90_09419 [Aureobasidium pullulans]